jgi:NADH-quinone oxidoreductase subunit F
MTDWRVLDPDNVASMAEHLAAGGGRGLEAAGRLGPEATIDDVEASGLLGRGGAGFPAGTKWRTVAANRSAAVPSTVVVNAAEGEPGSFKDRAIIRRNPFRVVEGALVAATTVGADRVVIAVKHSFTPEIRRLRQAIGDAATAGWAPGVEVEIVEGPSEYLFGEETGLLEVLAGRRPLPRVTPPYRHGADEVSTEADATASGSVQMAAPGDETAAPPTLVNNVETIANVPGLLAEGPDWFRSVGTVDSPGTVVCTITGDTRRHGVIEVPMGTPLAEVIERAGGGARRGRRLTAALSGVANPILPADLLDTPLSHEAMQAVGGGLGTGGFTVFDDTTDVVAVAQGVSRFLAVESCGQCTPCKQDGIAIADHLADLRASAISEADMEDLDDRLRTVIVGARCYLATQHQLVVGSLLERFPDAVAAHGSGAAEAAREVLIAPILDLDIDRPDARAVLDERQRDKQPDWTYGATYSGTSPADAHDSRAEQTR